MQALQVSPVAARCAAPTRRSAPARRATAPAAARRPVVCVAAATAEDDVTAAEAPVAEAPVAEAPVAEAPVAEAPVAETPAAPTSAGGADEGSESAATAPKFSLNFLWMEKNIGVAVDQVYTKGQRAPLTEYYMWPRKDAWEELKAALEAKPWVPVTERVALLNRTTEVINFWQDDAAKHEVDEAREKFPDCQFSA